MEFLEPDQYPESVRHHAIPFHTLGVQLLHSLPSGPLKRTAFRHLLEAQLAAVQSHWEPSCLYCQRTKENCGCKPSAIR